MIRRRAAVLTEWAVVFTFVLAPLIVIGGSIYGTMTSSSILSRIVAEAGERFATSGSWDEATLLSEATRFNLPIVIGRDTLTITITAADPVSCPAPAVPESWGANPSVCAGDTITIGLRRVVGDGSEAPLGIALPVAEEVSWSGVAQRTTGATESEADGGSIAGVVTYTEGCTDASGSCPVAGATVILEGISTTTTGVDGAYYLSGAGAGGATATLRVQADGYLETSKTVPVPTAGSVNADFTLIAGLLVRVHLVPASEPVRVSNGTFSGGTTGWSAGAAGAFLAGPAGVTVSAVSDRLSVVTGATASQGVVTTLAGSYKAGSTYLVSLEVEGRVGAPLAVLVGNESELDYAAVSRTASGGIETVTLSWTPQATYSSGVTLAIRANNNSAITETLYVDNVTVVREAVGVTGATVTATASGSTRRATETGDGWYVFILRTGSYRIVANAGGSSTTYAISPDDLVDICAGSGAGCDASTGPGSFSFDLAID